MAATRGRRLIAMIEVEPLFDYADRSALLTASAQQVWKVGPQQPAIWQNEVHIWRAPLDVSWSWTFDEALSLEDRTRADRFKFESDRRKFCAARASLRLILSRYLGVKPGRIQLETGDYGKPFIADKHVAQGLRFNLSHSHQVALISITRDREVGIDIEFMRSDFATEEVAGTFFSPAEVADFRTVAREHRTRAFFNIWTRKEAYIKARGEGLYCPLDQFDVSVGPDAPPMLLASRVDPDDAGRWIFNDIFAGDRYAATVAVEKSFSRLVLWDFAEDNTAK